MRRRATKQQIAFTIGLLAVLAAAGYWWSPHLWWAYVIARNQAQIRSIPVSTLEAPGHTDGWFTARIGPLSFKLPPQVAEEAERALTKERNVISLKSPSGELQIFVPYQTPAGAMSDVAQVAAQLNLSPLQFIADSYRTTTDDFRWTMSRAELSRHQVLLNLGHFYPHVPGMKVETVFDRSPEGVLMMHDKNHAMFEWQTKSASVAGYVRFSSTAVDLNPDQLRDICASLTVDEAQLGKEPSKSEFAALVDTMEIKR